MAFLSSQRIINTDDWREVVFLALGGLGALTVVLLGSLVVVGMLTSDSEQFVTGPVTLSSEWLELTPKKPLRPAKQYQRLLLDVAAAERLAEDNLHPERIQFESGALLEPEIQLVDSGGNIFTASVRCSRGRLGNDNELEAYVSDLPQDRTYTRVRLRSTTPLHISRIVWYCFQGK